MKTCLAGLMALGLVGLTTDTASARHRLGLGRWPSGRRLYRPALQLWRLWLSPSSLYYDRYSYGYGPRWRYRHRDWD